MRLSYDKRNLILSMTIFGTIGILRRYIPFPSSIIALVRGVMGAAVLCAFFFLRKEPLPRAALKRNLPLLLLSGALIGANWICLFEAYRYTTVSVATICYYMAPVFVILASPIVLHEALTLQKGLCCILALIGMILVSGVAQTGLTGARGIMFGLVAALMYAAIILINKFIRDISPSLRTLFQLGSAAITLAPYVCLTENLNDLTTAPETWILLTIAGILHTGIAYTLYFGSIEGLPSQTVALFSYIDPIVAVLLSLLILKEPLSPSSAFGIVLVLGAMFVSELPEPSKKQINHK